MKIEKNTVVHINYTLKDAEGNIIDSSMGKEPLVYLHGTGHLISGLEKEMEGKMPTDKFNVEVAPEDAYGMYNDEATQQVPLAGFDGDGELKAGMQVQMQMEDGQMSVALVSKIEGDQVTLDMNHPLAGKTLFFDIEVLEIRKATGEELAHGHVHGPGGHQH